MHTMVNTVMILTILLLAENAANGAVDFESSVLTDGKMGGRAIGIAADPVTGCEIPVEVGGVCEVGAAVMVGAGEMVGDTVS